MEIATRLDEPALPAATLKLPSAPIRKAIEKYRAAGIGRAQLIAVVDAHGDQLEREIAIRALETLAAFRADLTVYQWIKSFPSTGARWDSRQIPPTSTIWRANCRRARSRNRCGQ